MKRKKNHENELQTLDTEDFYENDKQENPRVKMLMYYDALIGRAIKDDGSPDQTMSSILSISGILKVRALVQLKTAKMSGELSVHPEEFNQIIEIKRQLEPKLLKNDPMEYLWKTLDWAAVLNFVETKTHVPISVSRTIVIGGEHKYNRPVEVDENETTDSSPLS